MRNRRTWGMVVVLGLLLAQSVGSGPVLLEAAVAQPVSSVASDDGDTYSALAIGVPLEDLKTAPVVEDAGAVSVLYSSAAGLSLVGEQLWFQDSPDVGGTSEPYDLFGSALAAGDFDGDGYPDLAVGAPGQDVGAAFGAGIVQVFYSSATRVTAWDEWWDQSAAIEDTPELADAFGSALAVGDFDGDGYDDLAVGVPREDKGDVVDAGAVNVIYGSSEGLITTGNQIWYQDAFPYSGSEAGDWFGSVLAAGYFNGDNYADLAIGVPMENWGDKFDSGLVHVMYGTSAGLSSAGGQTWAQNNIFLEDEIEAFDHFGAALCAGDFDRDGADDLAVGVPGENVDGQFSAGAVHVLYLYTLDFQFWYQDGTYVRDGAESDDRFGWALAAGDFDGNGYDDLAIGVPDEGIEPKEEVGAVNVLYGEIGGLSGELTQLWHQDILPGGAETGDGFGRALAAGDFDGNGCDDLAIGVPYEDFLFKDDAGAVNVLYGCRADMEIWNQGMPGSPTALEAGDGFGLALATIPFAKQKVFLPMVMR